jgi:hypothetical protein
MVSSGMLRRVARVRATQRNIPEGTILRSHCRENLKSYTVLLSAYCSQLHNLIFFPLCEN